MDKLAVAVWLHGLAAFGTFIAVVLPGNHSWLKLAFAFWLLVSTVWAVLTLAWQRLYEVEVQRALQDMAN